MDTLAMKKPKARKKPKPPRDPDYAAARRACHKTYSHDSFLSFFGSAYPFGSALDTTSTRPDCIVLSDLRSDLDEVIKSGWSVAAIKAYAFYKCRMYEHHHHVTASAWRAAVYRINAGNPDGAKEFLQKFNADLDGWGAYVK